VSEFSNKTFVNIREYYEKDGKALPGKKVRRYLDHMAHLIDDSKQGISLSIEQYNAFLKAVPRINAALRAKGLVVEGDEELDTVMEVDSKVKRDQKKSPKANIETTSEEED
jgi:PhoPQ-activated pathogenicity-related protein